MKDLIENIKKNNMKKLMLSAVLGMFCYCTNNAMEKPIDINEVLNTILLCYNDIVKTRKAIKDEEGKIYATIKDNKGKVKKEQVLQFITNQLTEDEQNENEFQDNINKIKQYFHLEDKKNDDESTKDNLTEIFWDEAKKEETEKINEENNLIRNYFKAIKDDESRISIRFKKYYEDEKAKKGEIKNVGDIVIEEIMNECLGDTKTNNIQNDFLANLGKLYDELGKTYNEDEDFKGNKEATLETIKRRITPDGQITKEKLKAFIKQKIGIEEKKEGGCCHCCDCFWKKPIGDLGGKPEEKKEEGEGGAQWGDENNK